jgi:hypothetical protein
MPYLASEHDNDQTVQVDFGSERVHNKSCIDIDKL